MANLLDNAVKYSEPGSVVRIDAESRNGESVIMVSDHGCGIGHEHLPRVFERFYRSTKAQPKLGARHDLAIVDAGAAPIAGKSRSSANSAKGARSRSFYPSSTCMPPLVGPR